MDKPEITDTNGVSQGKKRAAGSDIENIGWRAPGSGPVHCSNASYFSLEKKTPKPPCGGAYARILNRQVTGRVMKRCYKMLLGTVENENRLCKQGSAHCHMCRNLPVASQIFHRRRDRYQSCQTWGGFSRKCPTRQHVFTRICQGATRL